MGLPRRNVSSSPGLAALAKLSVCRVPQLEPDPSPKGGCIVYSQGPKGFAYNQFVPKYILLGYVAHFGSWSMVFYMSDGFHQMEI